MESCQEMALLIMETWVHVPTETNHYWVYKLKFLQISGNTYLFWSGGP